MLNFMARMAANFLNENFSGNRNAVPFLDVACEREKVTKQVTKVSVVHRLRQTRHIHATVGYLTVCCFVFSPLKLFNLGLRRFVRVDSS